MADTSETESAANKVPEINIFVNTNLEPTAAAESFQTSFRNALPAMSDKEHVKCICISPNDVRIADQPETQKSMPTP
jgi:hypothetical protein